MYKQVILVRADLKLTKGKMSAQVAHGSLEAYLKADSDAQDHWRDIGAKKVVLKVADLKELEQYLRLAKSAKLPLAKITDAGHTHLSPGTVTVLAIGPAPEERIDSITGKLALIS